MHRPGDANREAGAGRLDRREWLRACAVSALALASRPARSSDDAPPRCGLGLVTYCARLQKQALARREPSKDLFEPFAFLGHCREHGAGGAQMDLRSLDRDAAERLRFRAAESRMYVEAIVRVPEDADDVGRFDAEMEIAAIAGAAAARTVIMPGRRYERFATLDEFRSFERRGERMLELAAPIAAKRRVALAVENHKDQRIDERVALLERISSEWVGACVDTGNSFALLEDPIATVEAFAPWAHSVHLKDQAVREQDDGFLLGDVPLGEGIFDLRHMVRILHAKKPDIRFSLELITRDPLRVPCLTNAYFATMPGVPASDLARTLRVVRERSMAAIPMIRDLSADEQVTREIANVARSLEYARKDLGL